MSTLLLFSTHGKTWPVCLRFANITCDDDVLNLSQKSADKSFIFIYIKNKHSYSFLEKLNKGIYNLCKTCRIQLPLAAPHC